MTENRGPEGAQHAAIHGNSAGGGLMVRPSPARRATIQGIPFTLLLLLSVLMIAVGKTDQMVLASLRISVMDAAAPTLEILSRPASLLGSVMRLGTDFFAAYRENARLAKENSELLQW